MLSLDANGDGNIVWGELRRHQQAIAQYAFAHIKLSDDGHACNTLPKRQMVDSHADGTYAALQFDIVCPGTPKRLSLDYQLFFAIDPSHRGILVMRAASNIATAVLSPANAKVRSRPLDGETSRAWRQNPIRPRSHLRCADVSAIRGFTDSMRSELQHRQSRIHVTMVQLSAFNTPQF
ncbi:MAG: hypothetical protein ACREXP_13920, partial [Steroidobacteraceae bacterium]